MNLSDYWKQFERTGSINDYLNYACASEEWQAQEKEESESLDESGNCTGNGLVSHACWRLR
ncbi:hypothetical protein [Velocimicrobium porci]|uniref:Uncharacterized protein n=1 Tax=Velocimicrobium porci TaxID=2606634 RepID=A0A6L5XUQ5_9FIRM|nr:hypothetical protein [Velocimicrobium porci]MSS62536.1 hypothetical protein [Velocimicrobium porci]